MILAFAQQREFQNKTSQDMQQSMEAPHLVVQRQLQDVIEAQRDAYDGLKKQMGTLKEESVSLQQYETVLKLLEEERINHAQTKAKLMKTEDQLDFTQGQVEVLTKQIQREKSQFEKAFGQLKKRALTESCKNTELHNRCQEVNYEVEEKSEKLSCQEGKIEELKEQLESSRHSHQVALSELSLQHQQELYIAKMLGGKEHNSQKLLPASKSRKKLR